MELETQHGAAANLAKVFKAIVSPTGLAIATITAAIAALVIAFNNMQKEGKEALSNIGSGAKDFIDGISTAQSHLDAFNTELFVSSQEQHELEEQMQEVQKGITEICKRASDERRGYTQEEIKQLDEYFEQLRKLNERERQIQQNIAEAITQQAVQNAKTFEGTLEEYKIQSQEWIKTAEEQKNKTIELINKQTIEELAALNARYTTEQERQSEAYQNSYNNMMNEKEKKIALANDEVAKLSLAYQNGYKQRLTQDEDFYSKLQVAYAANLQEERAYAEKLVEIETKHANDKYTINEHLRKAASQHRDKMYDIWNTMYTDMDDVQEKELGTWLAMVAQTELYGGEIDAETLKVVNAIIDNFDRMPNESKKAMKETMEGMLQGMQNEEPTLYAKATGIAEGVINRLKSAFDIHSPSKETKKIFTNVMKGAEEGLDAEKNKLNIEIDQITNSLRNKLASLNPMRNLDNLVVERNKTIYTTPNIVFNVQELDKQRLEQCFNYVNLKFGAQY